MATAAQITQYYKNALGRAPSADEVSWWANSGMDAKTIGLNIAGSDEANTYRSSAAVKDPFVYVANPGSSSGMSLGNNANFDGDWGLTDDQMKRLYDIGTRGQGPEVRNKYGLDLDPLPPITPTPVPQPSGGGGGMGLPGFTPRRDSVSDAVMDLMKDDSALMRQAETSGLQYANRRGLLNSSMAAEASQEAAYRAAIPIGSQEAGQNFQSNLSRQNFEQSGYLLDREIGSRERMQQNEIGYQQQERALDRNLQQMLATWNLDSADRDSAARTLVGLEQYYANQWSTIMNNPNLSAEDRTTYLTAAKEMRDQQLALLEQLYDVALDWGQAA